MDLFIRQNSVLRENFQNELVRLSTFANFPPCLNVSFIKLASERFIYRGPGDQVECADCRKPFTNWRDINSLIQKHKTTSPLCNIACIDAHDIDTETDEASSSHQKIPMQTERNSEETVQQVISPQDICHVRPRYPDYAVRAVRLSTYRHWGLPQSPELMTEAGFYFTGIYDDNFVEENLSYSK